MPKHPRTMMAALLVFLGMLTWSAPSAFGQGGVVIDPDGILRTVRGQTKKPKAPPYPIPREMATPSDSREISLRALDRAIQLARENGSVPEELRLVAGLTRIDTVRFDAAGRDIWLGGPAEGWLVADDGREVGEASGRAVIHWEDLATALRSVTGGAGSISCSIDPTPEGLAAAQKVQLTSSAGRKDALKYQETIREALGRQIVSTSGVPAGSRFARTMVEADYLMKQMGIGTIRVRGVSNHLDALMEKTKRGNFDTTLARWWFTHEYLPPARDEARALFQIRGPRVKLLNEEMMVDENGRRSGKGRASQRDRFSVEFTKEFGNLQSRYPVFSDLANLYDLVWVAAMVKHQGAEAWLEGTALLDASSFPIPSGTEPREAEPLATHERHRGRSPEGETGMVVTVAYGGVSMNPGDMIEGVAAAARAIGDGEVGTAPITESTSWWHDAAPAPEPPTSPEAKAERSE